jgi:uncharacterized protein
MPNGLVTAGTVTTPTTAGNHAAVVFIAGSGPTNRNGDNTQVPGNIGTLRFLAAAVASDAVTLRFDKLGVGRSQAPANSTDITFDDFVAQAAVARDWLSKQPGVDPSRIVLAGHSEGALIALALAASTLGSGVRLALFSPPGSSYLSVIRAQLAQQVPVATLTAFDTLAAELRTTGAISTLPTDPILASLFNPETTKFLASADSADPVALAGKLETATTVMLSCAERDIQVPCESLANLRAALKSRLTTRFTNVELNGTNHVLRTTGSSPGTPETYTNPSFPHSIDAAKALAALISER